MSCQPILDCQIAYAQTQAQAALTDSVQVERKTAGGVTGYEPDGAGGYKPITSGEDGWTTVATIPGLLTVSRYTPRERGLGEQTNAPVSYDVYVAHGSVVKAEDRLIIASRTFEVKGIAKAGAMAILDRLFAVELQK